MIIPATTNNGPGKVMIIFKAWTKDIKLPRKRTTSKQEYIMKILAEQGYYIPGEASDL